MSPVIDIKGKKFGRLTVLEMESRRHGRRVHWKCRCDCGKIVSVRGSALKEGNTKSCGCLMIEVMREIGRATGTHHLSRTVEYNTWGAMIRRCYDPKNNRYQYYGSKGIKVCDRWLNSFEDFLADMGKKPSRRHSIDRYPNKNGNYEPTNCRWANPSQQNKNRNPLPRRPNGQIGATR